MQWWWPPPYWTLFSANKYVLYTTYVLNHRPCNFTYFERSVLPYYSTLNMKFMLGDLPVLFPYDRYVVSYHNPRSGQRHTSSHSNWQHLPQAVSRSVSWPVIGGSKLTWPIAEQYSYMADLKTTLDAGVSQVATSFEKTIWHSGTNRDIVYLKCPREQEKPYPCYLWSLPICK